MEKFKTGSCAFFESIEGFIPKDYDYVSFSPRMPKEIHLVHYKKGNESVFQWPDVPKEQLIAHVLEKRIANVICLFLVPEIAEYLKLTIEDLKLLTDKAKELDPKHKYLGIILDSYIENGEFALTDEQRMRAYQSYCETRGINKG